MKSKKRGPLEKLKVFSNTYLIFAVLGIVFAILILLIPSISDTAKQYIDENLNPKVYLEVSVCISIIGYLWYYWLVRRFINRKSKGTFYMILLILGAVGGLIGIFTGEKGTSIFSLALDLAGLYLLLKAKNENN